MAFYLLPAAYCFPPPPSAQSPGESQDFTFPWLAIACYLLVLGIRLDV